MSGYPWRPFVLAVALWGIASWLYQIHSGSWAFVLGCSAAAYGQWRYRCGQLHENRKIINEGDRE